MEDPLEISKLEPELALCTEDNKFASVTAVAVGLKHRGRGDFSFEYTDSEDVRLLSQGAASTHVISPIHLRSSWHHGFRYGSKPCERIALHYSTTDGECRIDILKSQVRSAAIILPITLRSISVLTATARTMRSIALNEPRK